MSKRMIATPLDRLRTVLYTTGDQPQGKPPEVVTGGMAAVPGAAAAIDTTKPVPAPRAMSPRQAEALMTAELLAAIRSLVESSTELTARLGRRGAMNGVIDSWGGVFPVGVPSVLTRSYEITVGSLVVHNHSAAGQIIVQSGLAAGDTGPQAGGVGVQYVNAGQRLIMPLGDRSWTMSGTAADKVSVQAFTGLQPFGVNL
jgi:hypothetical protein